MPSLLAQSSGLSVGEARRSRRRSPGARAGWRPGRPRRPGARPARRPRRDRPGPRWRENRSGSRPCRTGCRGAAACVHACGITPLSARRGSQAIAPTGRLWSECRAAAAETSTAAANAGEAEMGSQAVWRSPSPRSGTRGPARSLAAGEPKATGVVAVRQAAMKANGDHMAADQGDPDRVPAADRRRRVPRRGDQGDGRVHAGHVPARQRPAARARRCR